MRPRTLLASVLSLALVAGCQRTVRTRFALTGAPGSDAGSCMRRCDASPDPTACYRSCPGAVVEPGRSCKTRIPNEREACFERSESDNNTTLGVLVITGVLLVTLAYATSDSFPD